LYGGGGNLEVNFIKEPANYFGSPGMQTIEILLNKFLIFKVIFLTVYGNGLKLTMIFSPSRPISQAQLPASELLEINHEINRDNSPVASVSPSPLAARITLSPTELLEISEEITQQHTPKNFTNKPELVLLPVDPNHLYAYWNPGQDNITPASKDDPPEIVLRIYPQPDENTKTTLTKPWFDVVVDNSQTRQKVFVPMEAYASTYSATIGIRCPDDQVAAFATSRVVHVPRGKTAPYQCGEAALTPAAMPQVPLSGQGQAHSTNKNASGQANNK
jgi:Domain of unknown function (DUF4912)